VVKYRADIGISLDGDADRVILVDERGRIVNGDHILAISAIQKKKAGELAQDVVVATEMSNVGLEHCLANYGIKVVRTDVGDKYVVDEMRKHGYSIGGEQSGHIIYSEHSSTGDGTVAALHILSVMRSTGKKLSELSDVMTDVPQVLINTRVKQKTELSTLPGYASLIRSVQDRLQSRGRVFVRYSGTEPVVRVLVEGPDKQLIDSYAEEIATFLQSQLGK
jgi:phosphoglucosamine mutase